MLTFAKPQRPALIPGFRHIQDSRSIVRFEGQGNYTNLYLNSKHKPLLTSSTLKCFEEQFPGFIRISKSVLVNPAYIEKVLQQGSTAISLQLVDGTRLSIARRRTADTISRLEQCFGWHYHWKREECLQNEVVGKD